MSKPFDINKEIDQLSEKMVKSQKITLVELVSELGSVHFLIPFLLFLLGREKNH